MRPRHSITAVVMLAAGELRHQHTRHPGRRPASGHRNVGCPRTSPAPAEPLTAEQVLGKLSAAKIGLTSGAVQDEDTDPNNLLGRPNGYTSKGVR